VIIEYQNCLYHFEKQNLNGQNRRSTEWDLGRVPHVTFSARHARDLGTRLARDAFPKFHFAPTLRFSQDEIVRATGRKKKHWEENLVGVISFTGFHFLKIVGQDWRRYYQFINCCSNQCIEITWSALP
jgi:hypothetical protein